MILEVLGLGALGTWYAAKKKEAIEQHYSVDAMTDKEKREVVEYYLENYDYPNLWLTWSRGGDRKRVEIYREILKLHDEAMKAEPPTVLGCM